MALKFSRERVTLFLWRIGIALLLGATFMASTTGADVIVFRPMAVVVAGLGGLVFVAFSIIFQITWTIRGGDR